jgi:hypothetical protein
MLKTVIKALLLFYSLSLTFPLIVHAEKNYPNQDKINEGIVIYHIKYDYEDISNFLRMSLDEYNHYWKKGFSIDEMAKKQGISRRDLEGYFVSLHYNEMQKWRIKGPLTEEQYFDLVYRLADEIEEFIDRNPNH